MNETTLTSHLLPLQPPFPLIYIGEPWYSICRQIGSLIFVNYNYSENLQDFINSKDKFHTIPVVELLKIDYGFPYEKLNETWHLGFKEGRKNIPWQDIVDLIQDFRLPDNINKHNVLIQFAENLDDYGCTIDKPKSIKIEIELAFDDKKNMIAVLLSSPDLPLDKIISPEFNQEDVALLNNFINSIQDYKALLGDFKVKLECITEPPKPEMQDEINKIIELVEYKFDIADDKYVRLSEYTVEEIKNELLLALKQNAIVTQMGEDTKAKILEPLGKRLGIHPHEYPALWETITKNKWVWKDEYTGGYKVRVDDSN